MNFVNFPESNLNLGAPEGLTEDQVLTIPALKQDYYFEGDQRPHDSFTVCLQPSEEDRQAIAEGRPIFIRTIGLFPPMLAFTLNADGSEINP